MSQEVSRERALRILNLKEGFSREELKINFRKMSKVYHPDAGGTHEEFVILQLAYEELEKNPLPPKLSNNQFSESERRDFKEPSASKPRSNNKKTRNYTDSENLKRGFKETINQKISDFKFTLINFIIFKGYLKISYTSQSLIFSYLLWRLINKGGILSSGVLYFIELTLWITLTNLSIVIIIALFHRPNLARALGLDRLDSKNLGRLRNLSLLIYPLASAAGFGAFTLVLIILTLLDR